MRDREGAASVNLYHSSCMRRKMYEDSGQLELGEVWRGLYDVRDRDWHVLKDNIAAVLEEKHSSTAWTFR